MLKTVLKVVMTIGMGLISFWLMIFGALLAMPAVVLGIVDCVHYIWTGRRIPWIEFVMNGWADLLRYPFDKKDEF